MPLFLDLRVTICYNYTDTLHIRTNDQKRKKIYEAKSGCFSETAESGVRHTRGCALGRMLCRLGDVLYTDIGRRRTRPRHDIQHCGADITARIHYKDLQRVHRAEKPSPANGTDDNGSVPVAVPHCMLLYRQGL